MILSGFGVLEVQGVNYIQIPNSGGLFIIFLNFLKSLADSLNYENFDRPFYKKNKFNGKINNINFYQNICVVSKNPSKIYLYKEKPKASIFEKIKKLISRLF